jgi:hypothetical protein
MIVVSRSDSSGTSGQLSLYLANTQPGIWKPFEQSIGCPPPCQNWKTTGRSSGRASRAV